MKNWSSSASTHYTGFQTCLEGAAHESRLRARRIFLKDTKKVTDLIMKPSEYIKYIESLRAQIRR